MATVSRANVGVPPGPDWTARLWYAATAQAVPADAFASENDVQRLATVREIRDALWALGREVRTSTESSLPYVPSPSALARALPSDTAMLARGVALRSIYPREARDALHATRYAREVAAHGGEIRTGPVGAVQYVIADHRVAIIADGSVGSYRTDHALLLRSEGVVSILLSQFDDVWNRSSTLGVPDRVSSSLTTFDASVLSALLQGARIADIAERLSVSRSTVDRAVRRLHAHFGSDSRAALVASAQRAGHGTP